MKKMRKKPTADRPPIAARRERKPKTETKSVRTRLLGSGEPYLAESTLRKALSP